MSKALEKGINGCTFGSMIGGALGTIFMGTVLALPGVNIVVAPLVAAAATTITVSGAAAGTVIGGTTGVVKGAIEDAKDRKRMEVMR